MAENTVGAPTEGLGQTITFAANPQGGVSQARAGAQVGVRNDLIAGQGVGVNRAMQIPDVGPDPTMATLFKMGSAILAPKIKEVQTQRFVAGMQKAAEGQAVTDILDEQPWYAKAFGSTDVVDGARAYTANQKASEVAASIEASMHDLRKLNGADFSRHITEQVKATKTGDDATDAMVFQQTMQRMPGQMVAQAKQHYVFKQERMLESQRGAMAASLVAIGVVAKKYSVAGDAFQPAMQNEITDKLDLADGVNANIGAFIMPEGQDPKLHSKNVALALSSAASQGNLAGVYAIQDSGVFANMDEEHKPHVLHAIQQAEIKAQATMPADLQQRVAQARNLGLNSGLSFEAIQAEHASVNAAYKSATGSRHDVIPVAATIQEMAQLEATQIHKANHDAEVLRREAEHAATLNLKQDKHNQLIMMGAAALSVGSDLSHLTGPEVQEAWALKRQTSTDAEYASAMVNSAQREHGINKSFQGTLQTEIQNASNARNPDALYATYMKHYLPLRLAGKADNGAAATTYTGEFAARMDAYHRFMQATGDVSEPDRMTALHQFITPVAKPDNSKRADELVKVAKQKGVFATIGSWIGESHRPIADGVADQFVSELTPYMKNLPDSLDDKQKLKEAAKLASIEQYAGTFWHRGQDQAPIEQALVDKGTTDKPNYLQIKSTELDDAMHHGFSTALKKAGLSDTGMHVYRSSDVNKEAMFYILSTTKEGQPDGILVRGTEIKRAWADKQATGIDEDIASYRKELSIAEAGIGSVRYAPAQARLFKDKINQALMKKNLPPEFTQP